jgi:hypothetical protein
MMKKLVRILLALALVIGVTAIAGGALAGLKPSVDQSALVQAVPVNASVFQGTGLGPPKEVGGPSKEEVRKGVLPTGDTHSVGGCATLTIIDLPVGGTWNASVFDPTPTPASRQVLSCAVNVDFSVTGTARVCFAVPPGKEGKISFFDITKTPPEETVLETTTANGLACAPANKDGVYALVGQ